MNERVDLAKQPDVIFICYEDVIRSIKFSIIDYLLQPEIRPNYEEHIRYDIFEHLSPEQRLAWLSAVTTKNLFVTLAKTEFDFESSYISTVAEHADVMKNAYLLDIGRAVHILLMQKFLKKIYVYYPYNDERVIQDLRDTYMNNTDKIQFISGEFNAAVKSIDEHITSFIINDIDMLPKLVALNKIRGSQILLADYGYNYVLGENEEDIPRLKIEDTDDFCKKNNCFMKSFVTTSHAKY